MAKYTVYGLPGVYNATPLVLNDGDGVALAVNSSGQLIVTASALDVRTISKNTDSILIYGSDDGGTTKRVIKTDSGGAIQVDVEIGDTIGVTQSTSPWVVSGTVAFSNTTIAVTNAGTFAVQATLAAETTKVIGTVNQGTSPWVVSGTVTANAGTNLNTSLLALESGGNLATLAGGVTASVYQSNVKQINGITPLMGNGVTGTGSQRVTIASDNTAFAVNATLSAETTKVIGVTRTADGGGNLLTSNSTTYTAKFGLDSNLLGTLGTAFTNAGKVNVHGAVATNVAITDNPLNLGAQAVSSENAAVTTARQVQLVADLVGKLIVLPYANPENFVSGAITTAMTGTTSTSLVAAPAAGLRNYITTIIVSNAHATVGTDVIIQDGSAGTTLLTIPAASVYGGAVITLPTPLRQPTTGTAIYCANVTTGASTKVSAVGYKGA